MPGKIALLIFDKCKPDQCPGGQCAAVKACKHKLIKQESDSEIPMFFPTSCEGCGECVRACPQKAVQIYRT